MNLDATKAYAILKKIDPDTISLKRLLTLDRIETYSIPAGGGLTYSYAAKKVTDRVLKIGRASCRERVSLNV